jgi:hypothetical protein
MTGPAFASDIKPLFRETDRNSMIKHFDLWSHNDVRDNASGILEAVRSGTMPCDGPWGSEKVELFEQWVAGGMAE